MDDFITAHLPSADQRALEYFAHPKIDLSDTGGCIDFLLKRAIAKGWGDQIFLRSSTKTLTYRQTLLTVNQLACWLQTHSQLQAGNRVLIRGSNSIATAIVWMAVVQAGLVAVATMPLLRAKELNDIASKANIAFAFCEDALIQELLQIAQLTTIIKFDREFETCELANSIAQSSSSALPNSVAPEAIVLLAFTSGTTGAPKAAAHSHRDLISACQCWPEHILNAKPDDIVIGSPPLAFTFGLGGLLIFPAWAGASVFFPDKAYTPETMIDTILATGATICYTAPTFYRQMAAFAKTKGIGQLRISVSAGEALPDATRTLWRQASGLDMLDGIGATEMFHIFISSHGSQVRAGSIGKVVPGYIAKVVNEAGHEVPRGTIGKLAVIGPTSCKYLADERQSSYVKDGWNYPGDAFIQDADGYFFYQSRADDMIITAGYNVGGPEVESCLLAHAHVAECAVIGVPDTERGMIVKAFIVLKPMVGSSNDAQQQLLIKALQDYVKANLAPYKYPRQIQFVDNLPRTETGKLQRFKLKTLIQS
jgi:2-aminobenzoate-CoA ligase